MQKFLEEKREEIAELCRTHHVKRLSVFGSAAREDFDPERSDVDFLVEFEPMSEMIYFRNKMELMEALVRLSHTDVDLVVRKWMRNPYFIRSVEKDSQELYAA